MEKMTSYDEALAWLNSHINLEKKRSDQFKPEAMDVNRPVRLLAALGDPHNAYPTLHIAGTKGKGSVAMMCANCLHASGYRVGLFTSPHLIDVRERFRVLSGEDREGWIPDETFVALIEEIRPVVATIPDLTWYEIFTALAFLHYQRANVDVAVIEVGLGGRLDATNVVTPLASVITRISYDHTALLGNTLAAIATEKGGIIKRDVPVVLSPQEPEAATALAAIAVERNARRIQIGVDWQVAGSTVKSNDALPYQQVTVSGAENGAASLEFTLPLLGAHQRENAAVAVAALKVAAQALPQLTNKTIAQGMASVDWPGRLDLISAPSAKPRVIIDGAHNADSIERLHQALRDSFEFEKLWFVYGAGIDKDIEGMLPILAANADHILLTAADHPRAAPPALLQEKLQTYQSHGEICESVDFAVRKALQSANTNDLICVAGSLFLIGELLNKWDGLQSTDE